MMMDDAHPIDRRAVREAELAAGLRPESEGELATRIRDNWGSWRSRSYQRQLGADIISVSIADSMVLGMPSPRLVAAVEAVLVDAINAVAPRRDGARFPLVVRRWRRFEGQWDALELALSYPCLRVVE